MAQPTINFKIEQLFNACNKTSTMNTTSNLAQQPQQPQQKMTISSSRPDSIESLLFKGNNTLSSIPNTSPSSSFFHNNLQKESMLTMPFENGIHNTSSTTTSNNHHTDKLGELFSFFSKQQLQKDQNSSHPVQQLQQNINEQSPLNETNKWSSTLFKPETNSIAIPKVNDNMNQLLKSLINKEYNSSSTNIKNGQNICSSLSSSSEDGAELQFSPPLIDDITNETATFEHTEDFIRSLKIPLEILDDLASRFVLNMPQEEKYDPIRICFHIENAFWHYLDFYCECDSTFPKFKFKHFAQIMFTYVPRLRQFLDVFDDVINKWIKYKFSIPCSGAIILDESLEYILLVQGYYGSKTWGFPKGKVNHDESLMNCAIREVFEETGYNCMGNIYEEQYLERKIFESRLRLYFIRNVDMNYDFKPQARNEIRSIKWFALKNFPTTKYNLNVNTLPQNVSKFTSVIPFISAIRKFTENEKRKAKIIKNKERRQKRRLAKQQQQQQQQCQISALDSFKLNNNEQTHLHSNSSSPSTVEEDNNNSSFNQSTNLVDVDLKILGFREMYNIDNDSRDLKPRNETFLDLNGEDFIKKFPTLFPIRQTPLPENVDTLETIEQAMLNDINNTMTTPNSKTDINSVLGSKGSCDKKLNLLFGLAQNNSHHSPLINQMISPPISSSTPVSSVQNVKCATNEQNNKPHLAPIGTKRNSNKYDDSQLKVDNNKVRSGQTVISNKNSFNNNDSMINTNKKVTILQKTQKPDIDSTNNSESALLNKTFNNENDCHNELNNKMNYNGLEDDTVRMLHPKIELLMKRLKALNNTA